MFKELFRQMPWDDKIVKVGYLTDGRRGMFMGFESGLEVHIYMVSQEKVRGELFSLGKSDYTQEIFNNIMVGKHLVSICEQYSKRWEGECPHTRVFNLKIYNIENGQSQEIGMVCSISTIDGVEPDPIELRVDVVSTDNKVPVCATTPSEE